MKLQALNTLSPLPSSCVSACARPGKARFGFDECPCCVDGSHAATSDAATTAAAAMPLDPVSALAIAATSALSSFLSLFFFHRKPAENSESKES